MTNNHVWTGPTKAAEGMPEDLRWIAEHVSEWPDNYLSVDLVINDSVRPYGKCCNYFESRTEGKYAKPEWLQARKDLGLIMSDEEMEIPAEEWPKRNLHEEISDGFDAMEKSRIGGKRTAENFLHEAANLMAERGKQYDQPGGERSMGKAVTALNAITGRDLTEAEGWLLMSLVKRVRQHSGAGYHKDSAEDAVAYSALEAEALERSCL